MDHTTLRPNVLTGFLDTVARCPQSIAVRGEDGDTEVALTFAELAELVALTAGRLRKLGVGRGDRVALMMRNVWEFHVVDLAVMALGATPVSLYNSSSPEQLAYLVAHCEARVAVVEGEVFARRMEASGAGVKICTILPVPGFTLLESIDADRVDDDRVDLEEAAAAITPEQLATIIYTSGTTGNPKGVQLTHANVVWTVASLAERLPFEDATGKRIISYLPMAHIAERITSHYSAVLRGFEVTCCAEMDDLLPTLQRVRPQFLFGVPRVWEKLHAGVNAVLALDPDKQGKFADAINSAAPIAERMDWGTGTEEDRATWEFLDAVAFAQVRELVGLDHLEVAVTGAAPLPAETLTWFRAIGVPLSEIYGMSESTGPMTWNATRVKAGTVGTVIDGAELRLAADGEILFRGPNVFAGYLNNPEQTSEAIDSDGWLHSGDIGEIDEAGYVRIVDRKKELLITAGGKNISPANLESALRTIPLIAQACAIGDRRPYVTALVTIEPDVARAWATAHGIDWKNLPALVADVRLQAEIDAEVARVMEPFSHAEQVKKVTVLGDEWDIDSDVLTPTAKLKRRGVAVRYAEEIEGLYR